MKGIEIKQKNIDLLLDINIGRISSKYFDKSPLWIYYKFEGRDENGKPTDFTQEEREILKGAFCDLADRLRKAAEGL